MTASTVDALLPLSFLEAVRDVDTPETPDGEYDAEFVNELRNKRLGLSDTVYAQIRRYTDAVEKGQRTAHDEAVALARLIGRRIDAEAVFRAAGRHLAHEAYMTITPFARQLMLALPSLLARPMAMRRARRITSRYFNGRLRRVGNFLMLEVPQSVTQGTAPGGAGCAYYEAGLRELLRLLVGGLGVVEHTRCRGRGDATCEWRADWRPVDPKTLPPESQP
jgi:predicted hydrocarbon binding protein